VSWTTRIDIDREEILAAPYVWKRTGTGSTARIEANMPGAYIKALFENASDIGLLVCGAGNTGCPAVAMPIIEYSVDHGPFASVQLTRMDDEYAVPLVHGDDTLTRHQIDLYFRSAMLTKERWDSSKYGFRIAGFEVNDGATAASAPRRPKTAIGYGDSITEGVYSGLLALEKDTVFYGNLAHNNARTTWFPLVCAALGCEYGQLGTGGQGMLIRHLQMPPLTDTWDHFDKEHSRLTGGKLLPEPDYIFCEMGTNDFMNESGTFRHLDITEAYLHWLASQRNACPNAHVFCIVPPLGWHAGELARVVSIAHDRGDRRVHLLDTAPLRHLFKVNVPTQIACDGVHPHGYGNALLGAFIAAEAQKAISSHRER
jgi:lysophospholipase L1-like esterase